MVVNGSETEVVMVDDYFPALNNRFKTTRCAGAAFGGAAVGGLAVLRPRPGAVAVAVRGGLAGTGRMPEPWAGADIE